MDSDTLLGIVNELRRSGNDNARVEVKSTTLKIGASLWPTISAFSNTAGGIILLGLDENDGFSTSPIFDASTIIDQVVSGIRGPNAQVSPPPNLTIDQFPLEGKHVVVIEVAELEARQKPCFVIAKGKENGSYGRWGDGDHRLGPHEVYLLSNTEIVSRDDYAPVWSATHADLDPVLVRKLIERVSIRRPRAVAGTSGELDVLRRLQVIDTGTEHPTMAGLLALGKYPQQFFGQLMVSFASYPGTEKSDMTQGTGLADRADLEGAIPDMVDDAVKVVLRNLQHRRVIKGVGAADVPEIPIEAIREAIVNAVTHRDYSPLAQGDQVRIELYSDRLEVHSPGGIWGRRIETIDDGVSRSRNQVLARLLTDVQFRDRDESVCENQGSGVPRMRGVMQQDGLPAPAFRSHVAEFVVSLSRHGLLNTDVRSWLDQLPGGDRTNLGDQTLALLKHVGPVDLSDLRLQLGVGTSEQQQMLDRLCGLGLVEQSPSTGLYSLSSTATGPQLDGFEKELVEAVTSQGTLNIRSLSEITGKSVAYLRAVLRSLVEANILEATAPPTSRNRAYRIRK